MALPTIVLVSLKFFAGIITLQVLRLLFRRRIPEGAVDIIVVMYRYELTG